MWLSIRSGVAALLDRLKNKRTTVNTVDIHLGLTFFLQVLYVRASREHMDKDSYGVWTEMASAYILYLTLVDQPSPAHPSCIRPGHILPCFYGNGFGPPRNGLAVWRT